MCITFFKHEWKKQHNAIVYFLFLIVIKIFCVFRLITIWYLLITLDTMYQSKHVFLVSGHTDFSRSIYFFNQSLLDQYGIYKKTMSSLTRLIALHPSALHFCRINVNVFFLFLWIYFIEVVERMFNARSYIRNGTACFIHFT